MNIKRVTSSLLGFPLVALIFILGNQYIVDIFLAIIAFLGIQEYFNAISKKAKPVKWIGYLSCIGIAFIHILSERVQAETLQTITILAIPTILLILFLQVILTNMKTNFKDIAYTVFGIIYVIGCIVFLTLIRGLNNGKILIWYAMFAAWGTDIFAYLIGKRFGKHKLCTISPKKSVEGSIAGIVGAVILTLIYTYIISQFGHSYSYMAVAGITILLSIISQIGDIAASSIKRYVDIKDYSNLIPGHGGMLDRIDSLMFISPFAYVLLTII